MDKYTPGPWYVGTQNDVLYIITRAPRPSRDDIADIADVKVIGSLNKCNDDANACLIAAAPDLLEALKSLQRQALQSDVNDPANEWGREALEMTNAAIAKATGG